MKAWWMLIHLRSHVMFVRDLSDTHPAYRRKANGKHEPMRGCSPGLIAFDDDKFPDLAKCRDDYPDHSALWDAIRSEMWTLFTGAGHDHNPAAAELR
ncbi:hypothetical protein FG87_38210 [Nocardia vulneris]|uniref:Uncharacterized protein n=1 Tax=Nocardia vulneris TaxID=1141657 RepID=A0ABR4Z4L1_9NOCA|nr:hypothetical protein FG87_38210 [Nocardia vulneris]